MLCRAGTVLTASLAERLRHLEVDVVYLEDPAFQGIDARESVGCWAKGVVRRLMAGAVATAPSGRPPSGLADRDLPWVAGQVI